MASRLSNGPNVRTLQSSVSCGPLRKSRCFLSLHHDDVPPFSPSSPPHPPHPAPPSHAPNLTHTPTPPPRRRVLVGTFLAFDKYLNLVLSSCEENRTTTTTENGSTTETEQRRSLGLVILRGENVVSVTVEGPAPVEKKARVAKNVGGVVAGMGRGAAAPAMGLGGAVAGVGGGVGGYGGMGRGGGF